MVILYEFADTKIITELKINGIQLLSLVKLFIPNVRIEPKVLLCQHSVLYNILHDKYLQVVM